MLEFQCKSKVCWFNEVYEDGKVPHSCPKCGGKTCTLRFIKQPKEKTQFVNIDGTSRDNERWSWSMGINRQDIPAMMKKYPDRKYHPKTGQLLVKNRQHKKKLMREHGFEELA